MNEEEYISNQLGKRNPFTTPEGYFEQLTERVMSRLPEDVAPAAEEIPITRRQGTLRRLRPWLYAACLCGVIAGGALYVNRSSAPAQPQQEVAIATNSEADTYVDDAANYAMVDNQDIYVYLADM